MQEEVPISGNNEIKKLDYKIVDSKRIRVIIDLFEDHTKPNLVLTLHDALQNEVSKSTILGVINPHTEFTMHIRMQDPKYPLRLTCETWKEETDLLASKSIEVPSA